MKKYKLKDIKEILDYAEDASRLKEWYYPEVIAKLLFNEALEREKELKSKLIGGKK